MFLLALLAFTLSSCATLLDAFTHYDDCAYSGCVNKSKKGSAYCAYHDYGTVKSSVNKSLENVRRQSNRKK